MRQVMFGVASPISQHFVGYLVRPIACKLSGMAEFLNQFAGVALQMLASADDYWPAIGTESRRRRCGPVIATRRSIQA